MSAKEQIGMEVRSAAKPIVLALAKDYVLSLSKEIVPQAIKQSITDLSSLKTVPGQPVTSESLEFQS